jgi:primosomal protein N' (replication factor Y)
MERLQRVFGNRLGIYHSKYSDAERVEIWQKQLSQNPYDVILGARSAVFLPFQRLGLIIVDEEHETSYKQQDPAPRYHARSAAIMMAAQMRNGTKVLLGTATPSMESYYNAKTGKYGLVELKERYQGIELPEIQVVDVADLQHRKMMAGPFSPLLLTKVREALERGEQAILFQNRRGFAPMIECRQCGWVPHCQHCDVSLTLHRQMNQLTCHYCGYTYKVPTECPCCGSTDLRTKGYGTEKIEEQVSEVFPEARVARMDLDTTRTRNAYERIITDFSAGRTNILIGTQMISKGLDFDKVSVVGILNADTMLNYPDFRAYEHAFTMMSQVSGRAGRKGKRGLVILQTKNKDLSVIQQVVRNDYTSLYKDMIAERQAFRYPPYYRLVYVFLKHSHDDVVNTAGVEMGSRLRQWFGGRVLGPDKPAVAKVKSQNIRKLVLKLENGIDMKRVREYLLLAQSQILADKRYASLQIYYDVDPL